MGFPSISGDRQEHTLGWEEGKESRTDKHCRMDFGQTMNPKWRLFPAWVSLGGLVHSSCSDTMGLLEQSWMCQSLEGTWDTCGTYLNTLRAKEDSGPSTGNDESQQKVWDIQPGWTRLRHLWDMSRAAAAHGAAW